MYKIKKVHGTRFIGHTKAGLKSLLNNWIVLVQAFENLVAAKSSCSKKIPGLLKSLRNTQFLAIACYYLRLLDAISPLSLSFEDNEQMAYQVGSQVDSAIARLQDLSSQDIDVNQAIEYAGFKQDGNILTQQLPKRGHMRQAKENREYVELQYEGMQNRNAETSTSRIIAIRDTIIPSVEKFLKERFASFDDGVYSSMTWVDPAYWNEEPAKDLEKMDTLSNHFEEMGISIEKCRLKREWKELRALYDRFYATCNVLAFWKKIFAFKKQQFPNICKLVEMVLSIGPSNAVVECGFSQLTATLSDRRISLNHSTMENLLLLKVNSHVLNEEEVDKIMQLSVQKFLSKKRKRTTEGNSPPSKRQQIESEDDQETESESEDENYVDDDDIFEIEEN